jgi:hypothetical protein
MNREILSEGEAFFLALVSVSERLRQLWRSCAARSEVAPGSLILSTNFRNYQNGTVLEFSVDLDTRTSNSYAWGIDIWRQEDSWRVSRAVTINKDEGERELISFADVHATSTQDLLSCLVPLVEELTESLERISLQ